MKTVLAIALTACFIQLAIALNDPVQGQLSQPSMETTTQLAPRQLVAVSTVSAPVSTATAPGAEGFRPFIAPQPAFKGTAAGQPAPQPPVVEASTRPEPTVFAPPPGADGFRPFLFPEAPAVPKGPGVEPAQPETDPIMRLTLEQLRQKHRDAVADLKKMQAEELKKIKERLKGLTRAEIHKALDAKKAEHKAARKALEEANKAELERYKKNLPKPMEN